MLVEKEYMLPIDELKHMYPVGSIHVIDGIKVKVLATREPISSTNMASYPRVEFEKLN